MKHLTEEELNRRIGMPDIDAEWHKFEHEVINDTNRRESSWRRYAAVAAVILISLGILTHLYTPSDEGRKPHPCHPYKARSGSTDGSLASRSAMPLGLSTPPTSRTLSSAAKESEKNNAWEIMTGRCINAPQPKPSSKPSPTPEPVPSPGYEWAACLLEHYNEAAEGPIYTVTLPTVEDEIMKPEPYYASEQISQIADSLLYAAIANIQSQDRQIHAMVSSTMKSQRHHIPLWFTDFNNNPPYDTNE